MQTQRVVLLLIIGVIFLVNPVCADQSSLLSLAKSYDEQIKIVELLHEDLLYQTKGDARNFIEARVATLEERQQRLSKELGESLASRRAAIFSNASTVNAMPLLELTEILSILKEYQQIVELLDGRLEEIQSRKLRLDAEKFLALAYLKVGNYPKAFKLCATISNEIADGGLTAEQRLERVIGYLCRKGDFTSSEFNGIVTALEQIQPISKHMHQFFLTTDTVTTSLLEIRKELVMSIQAYFGALMGSDEATAKAFNHLETGFEPQEIFPRFKNFRRAYLFQIKFTPIEEIYFKEIDKRLSATTVRSKIYFEQIDGTTVEKSLKFDLVKLDGRWINGNRLKFPNEHVVALGSER